jgi:integrase
VKRPSCKWKGQTDADEVLPEARVARLAECRIKTEGGLQPTRQPFLATPLQNNGRLIEYEFYLIKNAYSKATIRTRVKILRLMLKHNVDLDNPEAVKLFIALREEWCNGHKQIAVHAYKQYAEMRKIEWKPPFYKYKKSIPFVPTEKEVDALINACTRKISTALQALKETGFRIGELWDCKWTDLDTEKSTIKCRAEKHGNPREVRISNKLMQRLQALPKRNEYIFSNSNLDSFRWNYDRQKTALAKKLQNPRLKQVHFHTLRHYHATKLFTETKSLPLVMERLGHRNINSTMVYTHVVEFDEESQNYHHATAKDEKEAGELIDNGWTYVLTTPQNIMMFRKRK